FIMKADGDGSFNGPQNGSGDLFGWSVSFAQTTGSFGYVIAGNFNTCSGYDGTRWDPVVNYSEAGTGMSTVNALRVDGGSHQAPGCVFADFTYLSFFLRLYAEACPFGVGVPFCAGDGSVVPCPCANNVPLGSMAGCINSLGSGGLLGAAGTA